MATGHGRPGAVWRALLAVNVVILAIRRRRESADWFLGVLLAIGTGIAWLTFELVPAEFGRLDAHAGWELLVVPRLVPALVGLGTTWIAYTVLRRGKRGRVSFRRAGKSATHSAHRTREVGGQAVRPGGR